LDAHKEVIGAADAKHRGRPWGQDAEAGRSDSNDPPRLAELKTRDVEEARETRQRATQPDTSALSFGWATAIVREQAGNRKTVFQTGDNRFAAAPASCVLTTFGVVQCPLGRKLGEPRIRCWGDLELVVDLSAGLICSTVSTSAIECSAPLMRSIAVIPERKCRGQTMN
jgi:hypothetical protein